MYNSCLMFPSIYCVVYVQLIPKPMHKCIGANVELSRVYTLLQKACRLESMCLARYPNVLLLRQLRSISVRVCAQFACRFAGCATPHLWHLNTYIPPSWCRSVLNAATRLIHWSSRYIRAGQIGALISSLAAVTRAHRFQVGRARYYWCLMACRHGICPTTFSASPLPIRSPVVVILVASDLKYRTRLSTVRERAFPVAGSSTSSQL